MSEEFPGYRGQTLKLLKSAVAKTTEEARNLIETGFEYVCTTQDIMLFRKRK